MQNKSNSNSNNIIIPIFDWAEILKSSPGRFLFEKIESRLPYVGKRQKSGWVESPAETIHRELNYSKFKNGTYQSEEFCASVMFGINGINWLCRNAIGISFDYIFPDWNLSDDSNKIKESCSEKCKVRKVQVSNFDNSLQFTNDELKQTRPSISMRKIYAYHTLQAVLNLRSMMRLGVRTGRITVDKDPEKYNSPISHDPGYLFFTDVYYEVWSFLEWMQNNSYSIPEELKYNKNGHGEYEYTDTITYGDLEQTFPDHPKNKPIEMDPLYIAVRARQAFIDGSIEITNPNIGSTPYIEKWIKNEFPRFTTAPHKKEMIKRIVKIVNDGAKQGGYRVRK